MGRIFCKCMFLAAMAYVAPRAMAQEATDPAKSPIPEEALRDAPAFGGSSPSDSELALPADAEEQKASTEASAAEWKPKLVVKLRIQQPGSMKEEALKNPKASASPFEPAKISNNNSNGNYATLKCDDIQVEVKSDDKGIPMYSFNCKGKAIISVSGNTITADSITTVESKLSASNAVIEMPNKTFLRSDKLCLELTIFEIEVKSAVEEKTKLEVQNFNADDDPVFPPST